MKLTIKVGKWIFEAKQFFARKCDNFGGEYEMSAVITITDGTPHVELLTNKHEDKFTRQDYRDITLFLKQLGFDDLQYSRFKNGNKKEVEETI